MHTDVNPILAYSGKYRDRAVRHLTHGGILLIDEDFDMTNGVLHGTWRIEKEGHATSREYSIRIYTQDEMLSLLMEAGFRSVEFMAAMPSQHVALSQEVVYVARA